MSGKRRILVLDGHPDPDVERFVHQLSDAYEQGAKSAGHEVVRIRLADLAVPLLRTKEEYRASPPEQLRPCLDAIEWAQHVVILHPLWLGTMPAALKALLEQLMRPGFAFSSARFGSWPVKFWRGKTARIVITMGMPKLTYWRLFGIGTARSPQRVILMTSGFRRIRTTLIGSAESMSTPTRTRWLRRLATLGGSAE